MHFKAFYLIYEAYAHTTTSASSTNSSSSSHKSGTSSTSTTSSHSIHEEHVFNTPWQSIIDAFIMTMGDVGVIYEKLILVPNHIIIGQVQFKIQNSSN